MAKNYEKLANEILELVGTSANITHFTHCATRLRFNVKDKSLIQKEKIEELDGVVGSNWFGDQFQIIIGGQVGEVYDVLCEIGHLKKNEAIPENLDTPKKLTIVKVFETISS